VQLLAVELRQEKYGQVEAIILASAEAAFGVMTLTLLTFLIVTLFWNNTRVAALLTLSLLCLLATFLAWRGLRLSNPSAFTRTTDL
jgi:uncharacterized membrane protein YqjE